MTTIEIELPEDVARRAREAGLLTPDAMESMLRERLRKQAGEAIGRHGPERCHSASQL